MISSREKILNRLKEATRVPSELTGPPDDIDEVIQEGIQSITPKNAQGLLEQFQKELELVSAEFHRLRDWRDAAAIILDIMRQNGYKTIAVTGEAVCQRLTKHIKENDDSIMCVQALALPYPDRKEQLANIPVSLVEASYGITDIGSLVFPYEDTKTSLPHFLSDCVFAVVSKENLVENLFQLFAVLPQEKARDMVLITGPSRTADIEKVLILGAHGPRRLVVLMIDV
jgi:L-lactate dehydrogenase complex protein LldG